MDRRHVHRRAEADAEAGRKRADAALNPRVIRGRDLDVLSASGEGRILVDLRVSRPTGDSRLRGVADVVDRTGAHDRGDAAASARARMPYEVGLTVGIDRRDAQCVRVRPDQFGPSRVPDRDEVDCSANAGQQVHGNRAGFGVYVGDVRRADRQVAQRRDVRLADQRVARTLQFHGRQSAGGAGKGHGSAAGFRANSFLRPNADVYSLLARVDGRDVIRGIRVGDERLGIVADERGVETAHDADGTAPHYTARVADIGVLVCPYHHADHAAHRAGRGHRLDGALGLGGYQYAAVV